jgi:hypothetical protein
MEIQIPKLKYNKDLYELFQNIKVDELDKIIYNLEVLGQGASGITFSANIKSNEKYFLFDKKRTRKK